MKSNANRIDESFAIERMVSELGATHMSVAVNMPVECVCVCVADSYSHLAYSLVVLHAEIGDRTMSAGDGWWQLTAAMATAAVSVAMTKLQEQRTGNESVINKCFNNLLSHSVDRSRDKMQRKKNATREERTTRIWRSLLAAHSRWSRYINSLKNLKLFCMNGIGWQGLLFLSFLSFLPHNQSLSLSPSHSEPR